MKLRKLRKIAEIGKAHGLRGSFYLRGRHSLLKPRSDELWVGDNPEEAVPCRLLALKVRNQRNIATLDIYKDRTELEKHIGTGIWEPADSPENPLDTFIGADCIDLAGTLMGTISAHAYHGASEILEILSPDESQQLDIPFIDLYMATAEILKAGQAGTQKPLQLLVLASTFEGLWS